MADFCPMKQTVSNQQNIQSVVCGDSIIAAMNLCQLKTTERLHVATKFVCVCVFVAV